ncbi:FecR family protein [Arcobacter sp. L]|uniref:FecR family protein n=1 Tax=Arcobacter sp. L TaxID=944547 RepID=UPI0002296515|nr:FecR domain-containing protein [Arcobacter sp. L]BAK73778.1 sigma factor regulator [Arcobacter sp. L]
MNKEYIQEKAAYFFTCKKDGFSKSQEIEFDSWITENIEHKKAFEKIKKLQFLYSSLSQNLKDEISKEVYQEIKKERSLRKLRFLSLAASVIFVIGLSIFTAFEYQNFKITHTFQTDKFVENIALPDGSVVTLDAKAKVDIKYYEDKREVNLSFGKALFNVTKDDKKPFIVNADKIKVQVLGTNFEVKNQKDKIDIDVINGKVSVQKLENNAYKEIAVLTQGKHISFDKENTKYQLKNIDIENIASWKNGILYFQNESLQDAINEFKKYKDINTNIENSIQKYSVSGSFKIEEFDKFLFALTKIYALKVDKKGEIFYISKKF